MSAEDTDIESDKQQNTGIITAVLKEPGQQSGIAVKASEADQRYEVRVHHPLRYGQSTALTNRRSKTRPLAAKRLYTRVV